ncbi:MAG TPA: hypothetical protein VKY31_08190, partial [Terriglobia bacterium]|nr:hypothetical protein [Terriglobia bacterium]
MKPDRWKRIEDLYNRACDLAPEEQDAFLRTACGTDEKLFQEVRRLLDENSAATEFLEDSSLMPSQPPKTDWVGELVGPYEFVSFIGAGGMGQVFRARDLRLKRDVAIKILPPEFSRNTDRVKRFQREAE